MWNERETPLDTSCVAVLPPTTAVRDAVAHNRVDGLEPSVPHHAARRILFVDHTASLGGGEIALLNLVRHFDTERYHPIVVLFANGPLAKQLIIAGIETHVLPLDGSVLHTRKDAIGIGTLLQLGVIVRSLTQTWRLYRFIRRHRVRLVHANSLKADIIAGFAARLARVPLVWHVRDRITNDYLPRPVVFAFRLLCRVLPTVVVANSNATLQTLRLNNKKRCATIYSGIVLQPRTRVLGDEVGGLSLAPPEGSPLVGLVGRITRWKGQDVFLRAAALVLERFPRARFQVIGAALFSEQAYEQEVKELPRALGIEKSVEFTGFRNDTPDLMERLDLLVHASTTGEPFGQVIVEGMAAGKAVVATNGGGVPEIVVDGQTGLLVPMGDHVAMASAICKLLEQPALSKRMGERGRERVEEHFKVEQSAARAQDLYDQLLNEPEVRSTADVALRQRR